MADNGIFDRLAEVDYDAYQALQFVALECIGQRNREGWTPEHDDQHAPGQMAAAAAGYAIKASLYDDRRVHLYGQGYTPPHWPWEAKWWKPKTAWRDLTRSAALCVAEMARRSRKRMADYLAAVEARPATTIDTGETNG